jgi:hypothetical protein
MICRQLHCSTLLRKLGLKRSQRRVVAVSSSLLVALPALMATQFWVPPALAETSTPASAPIKVPDITGTWQAELAPGRTVTWVFAPQGKLFMTAPPPEGLPPRALELRYQVNANSKPMGLNIDLAPQRTVLTIFELVTPDQMRVQIVGTEPGGPRPTSFNRPALFRQLSKATTLPPNTEVIGWQGATR